MHHEIFHPPCTLSRRIFISGIAANLAVSSAPFAFAQTPRPPATVLLIRHAEKPPAEAGSADLSRAGMERARHIPELFTAPHNLPGPDYLFATHASKKSNREVETLVPLSKALNLPISTETDDKDYPVLAHDLLSGHYAGKVVLVCWHHGTLPQFAGILGVTPPYTRWPDTQFDQVWRIDFPSNKPTLTEIPESLMPGDASRSNWTASPPTLTLLGK